MTGPQRETLKAIRAADARGEWFRARSKGERVVLVNLYRKHILDRRAWRRGLEDNNNAHEYRLCASSRVHR